MYSEPLILLNEDTVPFPPIIWSSGYPLNGKVGYESSGLITLLPLIS
jgi:hypothetical protein